MGGLLGRQGRYRRGYLAVEVHDEVTCTRLQVRHTSSLGVETAADHRAPGGPNQDCDRWWCGRRDVGSPTRLCRLDEGQEIVVFERSSHVSYANCGLPYYLGGVIKAHDDLIVNTPEALRAALASMSGAGTDVVAIDRARQIVLAEELATNRRYEIAWDRLVLSPGAAAVVPDVPGVERALTLRTVEDMDKISAAARAGDVTTAVVVGGGFVGLEVAENLAAPASSSPSWSWPTRCWPRSTPSSPCLSPKSSGVMASRWSWGPQWPRCSRTPSS